MRAAAGVDVVGEAEYAGARFRQYLRWSIPGIALSGVALLLFHYFFYPAVIVLALAASLLVSTILGLVGYRLSRQRRVGEAVLLYSVGMWSIALVLALGGTEVVAPSALVAILPVIIAIPHFTPRQLLGISLAAVGMVAVATLFAIVGAPLPFASTQSVRLFVGFGCIALSASCAAWLWHACVTLGEVSDRMERANEALRESERSLERRVRERTTELALSERALAEARDEAVAADRQKSMFLARMSHELRTPLNAILGFSEVLLDELFGPLGAKQAEYTRDIHDSGQHLLSLINDILDLAKVETGRLELLPTSFGLSRTIENALVLMKERAGRRGLVLRRVLEHTQDVLVADERKVKQVLINLLTNAVKFTPPGGTVTICTCDDARELTIAVEDSGVGIPEHEQGRIFEDYQQAAGSQTGGEEGTGLGLPLARRLVELHGGRIWVISTPGTGSRFAFTIPRRAPWQES